MYEDEGPINHKLKISLMETNKGLKLLPGIEKKKTRATSIEPQRTFYGLPSLEYQNYKYHKVPGKQAVEKRSPSQSRLADLRVPLEQYVYNIQTQRKILSNIEMRGSEQMHDSLRREFNHLKGNRGAPYHVRHESERLKVEKKIELDDSSRLDFQQRDSPIQKQMKTKPEIVYNLEHSNRKEDLNTQFEEGDGNDNLESLNNQWRGEFDELVYQSQAWLADYKEALTMNSNADIGGKLHFVNSARKGKIFLKIMNDFCYRKGNMLGSVPGFSTVNENEEESDCGSYFLGFRNQSFQ